VQDRISQPDTTPAQKEELKKVLYDIDMVNIEALIKGIKRIDEETNN
jgi:hypothetical protein